MARIDDLELPTVLVDIVDGRGAHRTVRFLGCLVLRIGAGVGSRYIFAGSVAFHLISNILVLSLCVDTVALNFGMGLDIVV